MRSILAASYNNSRTLTTPVVLPQAAMKRSTVSWPSPRRSWTFAERLFSSLGSIVLVLWVRAWQLEQRKCWSLWMDWSLKHYKLRSYGQCSKVGEWAQKGCTQVSNLTWLIGQAARSSSENYLMDEIVVIELLPRNSYYRASGSESWSTNVSSKQHPLNFVVYHNANIIYDCFDHTIQHCPW